MLHPCAQTFSDISAALYRGPFESPRWDSFIRLLERECGAGAVVMGLKRCRPGEAGRWFYSSDINAQHADDYQLYEELDEFINLPDGQAVTLHDRYSLQALEQMRYYRELLRPHNMEYVLGLDSYKDDKVAIFLRLSRPAGAEDFGAQEKSLLNALQPHLQNLILWLDRQEALNSERSIYENVVTQLALGTVVVDGNGLIQKMNPVAEYILNAADGLYIERGRLAGQSPQLNQALKKILLCTGSVSGSELLDTLSIPRLKSPTPLHLSFKPSASSEFSGDGIAADNMVLINAAEIQLSGSQKALQEMLGLTKAETRLAIELANGLTVAQVAEKQQVSDNTVRTHLKRIFHKTDLNSQVSLVNMVLRCIASLN